MVQWIFKVIHPNGGSVEEEEEKDFSLEVLNSIGDKGERRREMQFSFSRDRFPGARAISLQYTIYIRILLFG